MGRKKKGEPKVEKRPSWVLVEFKGGPKDGEKMRLAWPLQDREFVFADPEWCIYSRVGPTTLSYDGEGKYEYLNERARNRAWPELSSPLPTGTPTPT